MIRAIFFDFDGVLTTHASGRHTTALNLNAAIGIEIDRLLQRDRTSNDQLCVGAISVEQFWKDFCTEFNIEHDIDVLRQAYLNIPVDTDMMELARALKQDYTLGIITDNGVERFSLLTNSLQLDTIFDSLVCSGTVGSVKKTPLIFETALREVGLLASECVFIDNTESNLVVPKEMGFSTIYFDDARRDMSALKDELRVLGITQI